MVWRHIFGSFVVLVEVRRVGYKKLVGRLLHCSTEQRVWILVIFFLVMKTGAREGFSAASGGVAIHPGSVRRNL